MNEEPSPLEIVASYIEGAEKYGLVSEVVYFALRYMKNNPECSIEDAISYGFYEWIK